ncbi:DUF4440 domain-containing protein [Terriglobus roseus]|nr:DUF4440 domain-containing protein [Terriglobus roseus]
MSLCEELQELEARLLRLGPECPRECMERLLAPDFVEFGASGTVWTRESILAELASTAERVYQMSDVRCAEINAMSALLTYRVTVNGRRSLRSSLWIRSEENWQMLFHQGTVVGSLSPA